MKMAMKVALGALAMGLLFTGCSEECVDQFDCASKKGTPPEGQRWVCESNSCVARDVTSPGTGDGTDAGTDSGTDAGTDAGTDGGVACAELPHDAKLGTLQLQTGYTAAESAPLPEGIDAVTAVKNGSEFKLYGLKGADKSLYALGTWPAVTLGASALESVIAEEDRAQTTYLSGFLVNDGTRLLSGYTKSGAGFPGKVLVYDTVTPGNSTWRSAPGNFTAGGLPGAFFINGGGLEGSADSGNAIYALKTDAMPYTAFKLATFPAEAPNSGNVALASNDVAVFGYSLPDPAGPFNPYINHLLAVAPATYSPALSAGTTLALDTSNAPEIYVGSDIFATAGFGDGVAIHRGYFDASYASHTQDVSRVSLTVGGVDPKVVTPGELEPVLTTQNTCTNVVTLTSLGEDLLVGVSDKNGTRLVRLQKTQSP